MKVSNVYKISIFSVLAAVIITVPLRIYQYFKLMDPETGFYNTTDFTVYLMYAVLAAASVVAIALPLINKKKIQTVTSCKKSIGFLAVSLVMAVTIIIDSAKILMAYFDLFSTATGMGAMNINDYVQNQGGSIMLMQVLFGAIAALFFFINGLLVGVGNSDGSKLKILALSPVIWAIFKLLYRFKRTISFVNVSDLLLELFMIVFVMLYFLAFAQVISKIDSSAVFFKTISYGLPAILFAAICFIPRLILTVIGKADLLCSHYTVNFSDLGFIIFAFYNIISRIKTKELESDNK